MQWYILLHLFKIYVCLRWSSLPLALNSTIIPTFLFCLSFFSILLNCAHNFSCSSWLESGTLISLEKRAKTAVLRTIPDFVGEGSLKLHHWELYLVSLEKWAESSSIKNSIWFPWRRELKSAVSRAVSDFIQEESWKQQYLELYLVSLEKRAESSSIESCIWLFLWRWELIQHH